MLTAIVLLAITAGGDPPPRWISPTPPVARGPEPRWVWAAAKDQSVPTSRNATTGSVWLMKKFDVPACVRSASLALAADNAATAYVNGARVLDANDWSAPAFAEITLRAGANLVTVEARNGTIASAAPQQTVNPAGVIARIAITLADGSTQWFITDDSWFGATAKWPEFPAAPAQEIACRPAIDLGPATTKPWSLQPVAFEPAPPCPLFRRVFTLDAPPAAATVRIIGLGHYELRCNGERVADGRINQAWSQYDKTLYWQEFDLGPHLRRGDNLLGVALGNSFWQVAPASVGGRFTKTDAMPDFSGGWPHLLWLDARITLAGENAAAQQVVTDASWKWTRGPVTFSNL